MAKPDKTPSALAQAALAVDEELQRFDLLSAAVRKIPLDSKRNLERAARATSDAAASQQRLSDLVQVFMGELNSAREHNQQTAAQLLEGGNAIQRRSQEYEGL